VCAVGHVGCRIGGGGGKNITVSSLTHPVLPSWCAAISLPGGIKADLVLAEVVGSVVSEEGLLSTIRDAQVKG